MHNDDLNFYIQSTEVEMQEIQFVIEPTTLPDGRICDGVFVNRYGEWAGEVDYHMPDGEKFVAHFTDEGGDYVPAPDGWRDSVVEELTS